MKRTLRNLTRPAGPYKGWTLRMRIGREWHVQHFADLANGGKQEALREAIKARDSLESSMLP